MREFVLAVGVIGLVCGMGCEEEDPVTDDDDIVSDDDATADDDDSGGSDDDDSGVADDDDTTEGDDDDSAADESLEEALSFVHHQSCVGCDGLQVFGTSYWETEAIIINISIHGEPGDLFAEEQYDEAVRGLPVETCAVLPPVVFEIPSVQCLDAGPIAFEADWPGWQLSPVDFHTVTHNYSSVFCFGDAVADYAPGREVSIEAAGGTQIGPFDARNTSVDPLVLVSPVVNGDQVPDLDFSQPLDIQWAGGEAETVRIYLFGEWVTAGSGKSLLGCHVANDGQFTIPAADLAAFDPGQVVMLHVSDRRRYPLGVPGMAELGWTLGSLTYSYAYYDPAATP